jgi:Ca-activated chloride channel family protein
MKRLLALGFTLCLTLAAHAQSGVLLPADADQPNPAVLSLEEMNVEIVIDNGDARVRVTQIFANHGKAIQEGTYIFALPSGSTVSDFATWDGPVRIPAVVLERKRAGDLYAEARAQAIDPGVLEAGERDGSDPKEDSTFTAKIAPIPAYGTKRLELEYHLRLNVDQFAQGFVLPLVPTAYAAQTAAHLRLRFELHSSLPLNDLQLTSKSYPLHFSQQDAHTVLGAWEGTSVSFSEDFSATWKLDPSASDTLLVSTFRNPRPVLPSPDQTIPTPHASEPGFFLAQTLIAPVAPVTMQPSQPRNVVLLLDTSLSMQWDKLERSYAALEAVLLSLKPEDHFSLLLFNQDVSSFQPAPTAAPRQPCSRRCSSSNPAVCAAAPTSAKPSPPRSPRPPLPTPHSISSLTATPTAARPCSAQNRRQLRPAVAALHASPHQHLRRGRRRQSAAASPARPQNDGLLENVLSSEPLQPKLGTSSRTAPRIPSPACAWTSRPPQLPSTPSIRSTTPSTPARIASWVGDYTLHPPSTSPSPRDRNGTPLNATATIDLPAESLDHPQLPRLWAQARVNALLDQIARDGETRAAIDEIIALSRRYKFVTPYTSFLAVPRARCCVLASSAPATPSSASTPTPPSSPSSRSFRSASTKPLRHLASEDSTKGSEADHLWETRFLAPADMQDGTYTVRLILRDARGNTYAEQKTFVIASTPPSVRITLDRTRFHPGDVVRIHAGATAATRTLTAHLQGSGPAAVAFAVADLRWNSAAAASLGDLRIPATLAPGSYTLSVTAEDIAHNVGSQEVRIDVLP